MIEIGRYNRLKGSRETVHGFYLSDGRAEVLLPRRFVPRGFKPGDSIEVFVYTDSEDRPVATTQRPLAQAGDIAFLKVKDANSIGAFLDWGLDKDLFVPFKEQSELMVAGKSYVVKVKFDKVSGRLLASSRYHVFTNQDTSALSAGQAVDILICAETEIGYISLVDNEYYGLLYKSELFGVTPEPGVRLKGYIAKLRPDKRLDLSLRRPGFTGVVERKPEIIAALEASDGFLPFNSQSSTESIEARFNMSKRVFKQLIGILYKERAIIITDDGIRLNRP